MNYFLSSSSLWINGFFVYSSIKDSKAVAVDKSFLSILKDAFLDFVDPEPQFPSFLDEFGNFTVENHDDYGS